MEKAMSTGGLQAAVAVLQPFDKRAIGVMCSNVEEQNSEPSSRAMAAPRPRALGALRWVWWRRLANLHVCF